MRIDDIYPNYMDPTFNQINLDRTKPSVENYVSKITEQVERGELNEAALTLKEAAAETGKTPNDLLEKFWTEPTQITASERSQRGSWYMLLANDPDFVEQRKILHANAIREFTWAIHQTSDITEKQFYIDTSEKSIRNYLQLVALESDDPQGAMTCLILALECYKYLKEHEPKADCLPALLAELKPIAESQISNCEMTFALAELKNVINKRMMELDHINFQISKREESTYSTVTSHVEYKPDLKALDKLNLVHLKSQFNQVQDLYTFIL